MREQSHMTDEALLEGLGDRLRRFRLDRNLTQRDLATEAGVHKNTIFRLEAGRSTQLKNLVRVLRVLGLLDRLEALVPEPVPSPLRLLEIQGRQRKRAVSRTDKGAEGSTSDDWSWDDEEQGNRHQQHKPDDGPEADKPPGGNP